jgi:group I intron endonuclease
MKKEIKTETSQVQSLGGELMSCGIYKITNKINNKIYIGQSVNIEQRFYTHCSDALNKYDNNYFHNAIRKYGKENFYIEIIEECSKEELNEKEIYWIQKYNSNNPSIGYNSSLGGEGCRIFSYEKMQELWDNGKSTKEISELLHCSRETVAANLKGYKNFSQKESQKRGMEYADNPYHKKKVYQYDLNGDFIQCFNSFREAGIAVNNNKNSGSMIKKSINKKTSAYGFQWREEKFDKIDAYKN